MLSFSSVTKQFSTVRAVDNLSFAVEDGEIFALLGPNGAGKTTSVRMIMQIIEPDSGRIVFGAAVSGEGGIDRTRLGYLPEERGLYQDAAVLKTLVYLGTLRGMEEPAARSGALEWLQRFGLSDRAKEKISTLSKGNQQKVQFISSILHRPAFAVLDEPFSGLDPINQELISDIIRELRSRGMTILLSAHQMQLVEKIADRMLMIDQGRELLSGTMEEIRRKVVSNQKLIIEFGHPPDQELLARSTAIKGLNHLEGNSWEFYLGEDSSLNTVLTEIAAAGTVTRMRTSEVNLHEIFIESFRNRRKS